MTYVGQAAADQWPLRRGSLVYPMPVAIACGRVLRARTSAQRVDACLKAAEVLTRYLAGVAVASFASRDAGGTTTLSDLSGNLSFGHFLTTVQEVAAAKEQHPAAPLLAQGFKTTKRKQETLRGRTDGALVAMLQLRNNLGHELTYLDEGKANAIEESADPMTAVRDALQGVEELLSKPLFVVENQEWTPDAIVLRRLLLMGESADPTPQIIKVDPSAGVGSTRQPYVAINKRCLRLPPWLLWGIDQSRQNFALLFLDAVEATTARYCTLDGSKLQVDGASDGVRDICSGTRRSPDVVVLLDGSNFARDWAAARARIEESGRRQEGLVDWDAFDSGTVQWFAGLLSQPEEDSHRLLRERLLDGRHLVEPDELRQLMLLFGRPADVRGRLQRDVLDLRVIDPATQRPAERDLIESGNLLEALKRAVAFFAKQAGLGNLAPEHLRQTEGSVDYITLREIFVNQAIHQDYEDSTAAGQIEIHHDKVIVFNAGYSLVPTDKLLDGGKSQSRNPLIARALRLIGFAEISGSGIRAVHRACKEAKRKAPTFESDKEANSFTLTLDWSESTTNVDTYWHTLVGVDLTKHQAAVLNAIGDSPSVTIGAIESETGLDTEDIAEALDFLVLQVLVEQDESNYRLAEHIKEKLG